MNDDDFVFKPILDRARKDRLDRSRVLAPYLALVGLVGAVTVAVTVTRRRKP